MASEVNYISQGRSLISKNKWRFTIHKILTKSNHLEGKLFDTALLSLIFISVVTVILQSVPEISQEYGLYLLAVEMFITGLFAFEYFLRVYTAPNTRKFVFGYLGVIDLLAILPCFVGWLIWSSNFFLLFRVVRILKIFKVLNLTQYTGEAKVLTEALSASRAKIIVFIVFVITVVVVVSFLMFLIEGNINPGFSSIPRSMYWSVVTMTTVGYGDIAPVTGIGRFLASALMLLGYGVLAVPTGIVSAEISYKSNRKVVIDCLSCGLSGHDDNAKFCKNCGTKLERPSNPV